MVLTLPWRKPRIGAPPVPTPELTGRERLVASIVELAVRVGVDCDEAMASAFVAFLERVRDQLGGRPGSVDVVDEDLAMFHRLMLAVMPDEVRAEPGSVHAAANATVLGGGRLEFVHSARSDGAVRYCTVELRIVRRRA